MTLREVYIQGLIAKLSAASGFPASVERSISIAFSREESPVVVVHRGSESLENTLGSDTYRSCEILVSVITRNDAPDKIADDIMEVAHPLVMTYQAAGLIQMEELGTNAPVFSNTDSQACMMTTRYRIQYCSGRESLNE